MNWTQTVFLCCTLSVFSSKLSFSEPLSNSNSNSDTIMVSYQEVYLLVDSFGFFVVENESQYLQLYRNERRKDLRNKINFKKYVLMGFNDIQNESQMEMNNRVYEVSGNKQITFEIQFLHKSHSAVGYTRQYWILVKRPNRKKYNYQITLTDVP
jgi:hypothetical protein